MVEKETESEGRKERQRGSERNQETERQGETERTNVDRPAPQSVSLGLMLRLLEWSGREEVKREGIAPREQTRTQDP